MKQFKIAVQIYSVRDVAETDFRGVMKKIKAMGYDGVELAGLYSYSPKEIREILANEGLEAVSAHVPYLDLTADMEGTIGIYKQIGCSYIAIPYLTEEYRPGTEKFFEVIENIKKLGQLCNKENITLLYHNHDFEFVRMENGSFALDYLYSAIGPELLQTEIDTCWVKVAGLNPADYVKKYAGRCPLVHLKDYVGEKSKNMYELIGDNSKKIENTFGFRAVGTGVQDVHSILMAADESGAEWLVVEQDYHPVNTGMENIKLSIDCIKKIT